MQLIRCNNKTKKRIRIILFHACEQQKLSPWRFNSNDRCDVSISKENYAENYSYIKEVKEVMQFLTWFCMFYAAATIWLEIFLKYFSAAVMQLASSKN